MAVRNVSRANPQQQDTDETKDKRILFEEKLRENGLGVESGDYSDVKKRKNRLTRISAESEEGRSSLKRLKSVREVLEGTAEGEGGMKQLLKDGVYVDAFPVHNDIDSERLRSSWQQSKTTPPIDSIRLYFGAEVALFFCWIRRMTFWLMIPAFLWIICVVYGATVIESKHRNSACNNTNETDIYDISSLLDPLFCLYSEISHYLFNPSTLLFSIFLNVGALQFTDDMKSECSKIVRPKEEVTDDAEPQSRRTVLLKWVGGIVLMIVYVILLGSTYYGASLLYEILRKVVDLSTPLMASIATGSLNLLLVTIVSQICYAAAAYLTDLEQRNRNNEEEWMISFSIKVFLLETANNFIGPITLMFSARKTGMVDFSLGLFTLVVGKILIGNAFSRYLQPVVLKRYRKSQKKGTTAIEKNEALIPAESYFLVADYMDFVVNFGFMTWFGAGLPVGALCLLLNNVAYLCLQPTNMLNRYRRPMPRRAHIGIWPKAFASIAWSGVFVNGLVVGSLGDFSSVLISKSCFDRVPGDFNPRWAAGYSLTVVVLYLCWKMGEGDEPK